MIAAVTGKGGVGKTTLVALLLDEIARAGYLGRVLVVDGDPATTLHLALGLPDPPATVVDVREGLDMRGTTLRSLPNGMSRGEYVLTSLRERRIVQRYKQRGMEFDFMAMGQGEGHGCYCAVNGALSAALKAIMGAYDIVLVDNEAGLEHLNRYRIAALDMMAIVEVPGRTSRAVALRILDTVKSVGMTVAKMILIENRGSDGADAWADVDGIDEVLQVPVSSELERLDADFAPSVELADDSPVRKALSPIIAQILATSVPGMAVE
jgi:CO dehydrogenase maturation factor